MDGHMRANERLKLAHPEDSSTEMSLFIWDFGGQQIYHATHQFFLTDKSLFVLVWNGRLGYHQCKLEYWLDMVKSRAPESPILIIATHLDERSPESLPLEQWKKQYNIVGSLAVSNSEGTGIPEAKQTIANVASELPLMGQEHPIPWVQAISSIKKRFQQYDSDSAMARNYFQIESIFDVLQSECRLSRDEARMVVQWYHDLGGLLHYPEDGELRDLVILNPWWASRIINRVFDEDDPDLNQGVLTPKLQDEIWSDVAEWLRPRFVSLMEKFDLAYRIPDGDGTCIVVGRLPVDPPDYQSRWNSHGGTQLTMRYQFEHDLPPGIPGWFIAREHRFSTGLQWRYGVLLQDEEKSHLGLVKADPHRGVVELSVRGPFPQNFFSLLKDGIEVTLRRFPGLAVARMLPCPCQGTDDPCSEEFEYSKLIARLEKGKQTIECHASDDDVSIPKLLFGWSTGHQSDLLNEIHADLKKGFMDLTEQNRETIAMLQRQFLALFTLIQSSVDNACPNVFLLRPGSKGIITKTMRLELFCQEPGHWHPVEGGCYDIKKGADWLQPILPYAKKLLDLLRWVSPTQRIKEGIEDMASFVESGMSNLDPSGLTEADGAALRKLRQVLDEVDPDQVWGGLKKVPTAEGHILWLCPEHAKRYE